MAVVAAWTFGHERLHPFPRRGPALPAPARAPQILMAPLDAHIPSDAEIWEMAGIVPLSARERVAKELDQPRPGLLTKMISWANLVVILRDVVVSTGHEPALAGAEHQEGCLGAKLRRAFTQMALADCIPPNNREPRLTLRAVTLYATTMHLAANSTAPGRTLRLADALNYSGRSHKEALVSLVGAESAAVPGRFGLPPPPDDLPDLIHFGVPRMAQEVEDDFPLESLRELSDDVEALREACVGTVAAFQESREAVAALCADFLGRLAPIELRVPANHTFATLEDLQDYRELGQGHLERLRDVVSDLAARTARLEVALSPATPKD